MEGVGWQSEVLAKAFSSHEAFVTKVHQPEHNRIVVRLSQDASAWTPA